MKNDQDNKEVRLLSAWKKKTSPNKTVPAVLLIPFEITIEIPVFHDDKW